MIVLLLQQPQELLAIHEGLRIPEPSVPPAPQVRSGGLQGSGLNNLFGRGVHFDDAGTCYVWHHDSNCYAIPINIWSHPASPIRESILRHWPHPEQLSFWQELFEPAEPAPAPPAVPLAVPEGLAGKRR